MKSDDDRLNYRGNKIIFSFQYVIIPCSSYALIIEYHVLININYAY